MDNLTHTLIGVGLARAGLAQRWGRGTTVILAVASNLPDVDVACLAGGPLAFLWRRTVTHGFLGCAVLAVVATLIFRRLYPHLPAKVVLGLTALGIAGHVFADLWNAYGVVLFWPWSGRRIDLDWVFIVDLQVWGILVGSWLLSLGWRLRERLIWRTGLLLLVTYLGVCAWASSTAEKSVRQHLSAHGLAAVPVFVYPEPFGPTRFRGVARVQESYHVFEIHPFTRHLEPRERVRIEEPAAVVQAARRTEAGQRLEAFFSTSVWTLAPDGQSAQVRGMGFRTPLLPGRDPFVFQVTPDGRVSRMVSPAP